MYQQYEYVGYTEKLLNLIKEGELTDILKRVLGDSFPYNIPDKTGSTLLHYSVRYNSLIVMKHLLAKGCNVDKQDNKGNTPLMIAVMANHDAAMTILLAAGANVLTLNKEKRSALHMLNEKKFTIKCETAEVLLRVLREQCSSSEMLADKLLDAKCPLYLAVLLRDVEIIERMLQHDAKLIEHASPANRVTALHVAVFLNDSKIVNTLVDRGANVDALDIFGVSPLHNLYKKHANHSREKIEIMKTLLNRGATTTSCIASGDLQMCHALIKGNDEAIRVLIESGRLDFKAKSSRGERYPIHYLAANGNPGVPELLRLHSGEFDVDARDTCAKTPLFIATVVGNVGMVKFLLEIGAKTDVPHRHGITALHFACASVKAGLEQQYRRCCEMLLRYDADPQIVVPRDGKIHTIFDTALRTGDLKRIKPVVAHLAMLEKRGRYVTELTRAKIDSHRLLKNYFERCQRLLEERIAGRVAILDLITADEKRMARYLNNKSIVRKVRDKKFRSRMSNYQYYFNILNDSYVKGDSYRKLKCKAATIVRGIFRNRIDETHIVVDNITDYLDDRSLEQLCKLLRPTRKAFKKNVVKCEKINVD